MKNKIELTIYLVICFLLCVIPLVGMTVARTDTTTENRRMAELPKLIDNKKINIDYMQELGDYFEDHFAFKNVLVTADSNMQTKVFGVSNMDTVIAGKNGWLYYTDTLDDYLGQNTLSDRGIFNASNNLSLLQRYVEEKGAAFLLTIAPNKNSLYGENMPYYYGKKVSDVTNASLLMPQIEKLKIPYADLFSQFQQQDEILYLKRDSHWNNKGAVLAYNTILDGLNIEHENYESVNSIRTKSEIGDLNRMLYPLGAEPEWNYEYQNEKFYTYENDIKSVEDAWIETENSKGNGTLLMFRDSFGNTLLPLMANTFAKGYFSKGVPYQIESYMNQYETDTVIVEKVERNINEFAEEPPIMTGLQVEDKIKAEEKATDTSVSLKECEYDTSFWKIEGVLDGKYVKTDTKVYVKLTTEGKGETYEAFTVSDDSTDNGYLLYLPKETVGADSAEIEVIVKTDDIFYSLKSMKVDVK